MADETRKPGIVEEVAKIVAGDPGVSTRTLARQTGVSKSEIARILQKPITRQTVDAILAQGGPMGHTHRSIGAILAGLTAVTDSILEQGIEQDADIAKLLQLLQALSTTVERLAKAGIDLSAAAGPLDDTALRAELAAAYARGLRAALRWPGAAARAAARIEEDTAGPPNRIGRTKGES